MRQEKIDAYFLRVSQSGVVYQGYIDTIEDKLEVLQAYVNYDEPGGYIDIIRLTDEIDCVINDNGKLIGLPNNRIWIYDGQPIDILVGNCLCVRHDEEGELSSISRFDIPTIESCLISPIQPVKYTKEG
jgi:hypothetical protein